MANESLIDRVAEALFNNRYKTINWQGFMNGNHYPYENKEFWLEQAKAAIAAMTGSNPKIPSPEVASREISVVKLLDRIEVALEGYAVEHERVAEGNDEPGYSVRVWGSDRANLVAALKSHLPTLRHHLRTNKPVSVSLDKVSEALIGSWYNVTPREMAKAVLDAAGVKYE